jgi:hypothetical protein
VSTPGSTSTLRVMFASLPRSAHGSCAQTQDGTEDFDEGGADGLRSGGCMHGSATKTKQLLILAVATAIFSLASAAGALANPLLSGYGGPGEGSQAILGSALIGGPPSSGGPSEGQGPGVTISATAPGGSGAAAGSNTASSGASGGSAARHGAGRGAKPRVHATRAAAPVGGNRAGDRSEYSQSAYRSSAGGPALGFSDGDVLIMLLAMLGIAITALVTRRFARVRVASAGVVAKGVSGTTRPRA